MARTITTVIADGIATLTFGAPPLNLVTETLTQELGLVLDALAVDEAVRVLVVTGSGDRAFCGGSDIKEFPSMMSPGAVIEKKLRLENIVYSKLAHFPAPTIAAVRGLALGGGLELAVCCDIIVADDRARLALPEIKLGIFPGSGGTVRVARRVGQARARRMIFLGEDVPVADALAWGLVDKTAPKDQVMDEVVALARLLAARSGQALRRAKEALAAAVDEREETALEAAMVAIDRAFCSTDIREGVQAFREKRLPRFVHG